MKKGDRTFLLIAAVIAAVLFAVNTIQQSDNDKTVVITVDGVVLQTFDLSTNLEQYEILTPYGQNTMTISDGAVKVTSADCPDQICVHTKAATDIGDVIVCLPHRLIISVEEAPAP